MKLLEARQVDVVPELDMETYSFLCQSPMLSTAEVLDAAAFWERWVPLLRAWRFGRDKGYVAVYLEEDVEKEVDALWAESQSRAFRIEAVAQTMIMGGLRHFLPRLDRTKCAPVPVPTKILKRTVEKAGLVLHDTGTVDRKYSTLTYYPHKDGCTRCYLKETCPKRFNWSNAGLK
ncbi:MAG: hypothetical protein EOM25_08655 [Deltaproteobacteria bacterium]|nr:hypothetical protein [Deltaproteobacteria bacterium]